MILLNLGQHFLETLPNFFSEIILLAWKKKKQKKEGKEIKEASWFTPIRKYKRFKKYGKRERERECVSVCEA